MKTVLAIGVLAVILTPGSQHPSLVQQLVGTWELVAYERQCASGQQTMPYGAAPRGILMYDAGGRMSAQLVDPQRPTFAANDFLKGSADEVRRAFEGYFGYFGTYSVDEPARTVTHHVKASSYPNYTGTDQKRFVELAGDQLVLRTPPLREGGSACTFRVVWRRA